MDDRVRRDVLQFVATLAASQQKKLAAAGTFVDIEELTAEIGDEVARQLANVELSRRSDALSEQPTHACPDCRKECRVEPDLEPIILQGMRGEIQYAEPRCHCSRCRRNYRPRPASSLIGRRAWLLPSGRPDQPAVGARTVAARECDAESA